MEVMNEQWTEVDGVATVCAGVGDIAGPLRATLTIGSGFVDESLRNYGIDHVVEHLAFHDNDQQSALLFNGTAESMTTNFSVAGTPDQVADFFEHVTGRLADLPLDRLEDELRVLQVEARGRGTSPCGGDLEERFGPHGGGLLAWPELGLRTVDRDEVAAWSRERFTATNAVLWCSGPLPRSMSLAGLPAGEPMPRAPSPDLRTPPRAFVPMGRPQVGVSFVAKSSWNDAPAVEVVRQHAFDRLRAAGLSYSVTTTMIRLDPVTRYWCVMADGIDGNLDRVLHELLASVEELAAHGPTEEAVEKIHALHALARSTPDHLIDHLDNCARRHLFGLEPYTLAEADEHVDRVTASSLRAELELLLPTALAFGPDLASGAPEGWTRHASWERDVVPGRRYEPITGRERGTLIAGSRGITKQFDDGRAASVRWKELEACIVDESTLHLVDRSGTVVMVNAAHWRGGERLTQLVRDNVEPSLMIALRRSGPTDHTADRRAHAHWLATLAGVTAKRVPDIRSGTVSLVIDTDGLFVITEAGGDTDAAARQEMLRTAEREELLAADARNRWIPRGSLEAVELRGPVVIARGGSSTHRLRVRTDTGSVFCFRLSTPKQADLARGALSAMLGRRFHEQRRLARIGARLGRA